MSENMSPEDAEHQDHHHSHAHGPAPQGGSPWAGFDPLMSSRVTTERLAQRQAAALVQGIGTLPAEQQTMVLVEQFAAVLIAAAEAEGQVMMMQTQMAQLAHMKMPVFDGEALVAAMYE